MAAITMETIKIGRVIYDVKPGDYILDNGACHQFIAGDKRTLKIEGFTLHNSLIMPKTLVKKIPFIRMTKVSFNKDGASLVKWYF